MAVTGIGISDDHLLKILGFRLIPVAAGGHLGSKIARTLPNLKVGMSSGPEIHGFSPVGSQYGIFGPVPRYFPRNLQKPETRPIFAMAKMSPRESHFLAVGVVRWAPNLHIFDSTHQDLTLHRECRSISFGKGWYQCPVGWVIGTPNFQHGRG